MHRPGKTRGSLGRRLTSFIILITFVLGGITLAAEYLGVRSITERYYATFGRNLARTAAALIDGDSIDHYLTTLVTDQRYEDTLRLIRLLRKQNNILHLYAIKWTSPVMTRFIYDSEENSPFPLGYPDPWQEEYAEYGEKMFRGEEIEPITSNGPYGWIITIYEPIHGSGGAVTGYVGLDFSMDRIAAEYRFYLFRLGIAVILAIAVFSALYFMFVRNAVILPLTAITKAAAGFLVSSGDGQSGIAALNIRTNDELQSLVEAMQLMEQKINRTIKDLVKTEEAAQTASRSKSIFLARMSHEIRTPLNAILGLSEVELQDKLPDKTRLNLEKIYHSGSHLLEIINDILDISKIESGNFEIVPAEYELSTVINDTIRINILRIGLKQLAFKLEFDPTIPVKLYGDELRIRQILNNLLSNAFKYTEEGEVRLRINWEHRDGGALLYFTVKDTGRGIKQEDMEKLFSDYTQLDAAANRRIEGTGLGLSICRGLVETMGGTVTVESEYGKGSTFRVSLPQRIVDERPVGRETAENLENFRFAGDRTRSRGNIIRSWMPYGKVLVVDDLPTNLDVMTGLLMSYGLKVDTALSGREAVERIRKEEIRYDLVFMDHMMPEMDGIEAVRIIRNEIGTDYAKTLPIVVLTANAIEGNRELFLESGFDDFVSKPIDIKQLDMVLNQWIRDRQSEETLREAESHARERERAQEEEDEKRQREIDAEDRWLLDHPVEGADFAEAMNLYGSGAAFMPILKSFVTNTPLLLEKMGVSMHTSLEEYTVKVHGLKGACGAVCAEAAAVLARELEFAAARGDSAFVLSRHGELSRQVLDLIERIKILLGEWEAGLPKADKEQRDEPDKELLARLSAAAAGFNSAVIEELLEELEQFRYAKGEDLVRLLREQADNFDYDVIHRHLKEFLPQG